MLFVVRKQQIEVFTSLLQLPFSKGKDTVSMSHWTWIQCISITRNKNFIISTAINGWDINPEFLKWCFLKQTLRSLQNRNSVTSSTNQCQQTVKYNCFVIVCIDIYYFPPDITDSFPLETDGPSGVYINVMLSQIINVSVFLYKKCATFLIAQLDDSLE